MRADWAAIGAFAGLTWVSDCCGVIAVNGVVLG
jgi:hypothetical protein